MTKTIELNVKDKTYKLDCTFKTFRLFQEATDKDAFKSFQEIFTINPSGMIFDFITIRNLFWATLQRYHSMETISLQSTEDLIDEIGYMKVCQSITSVLQSILGITSSEEIEEKQEGKLRTRKANESPPSDS